MGERHQIYLKLPDVYYNENNPNNHKGEVIGIHHQWLWGATLCKLLAQFCTYVEKARVSEGAYMTKDTGMPYAFSQSFEAIEVLSALFSVHAETGYYHGVHKLEEDDCKNPLNGDNNTGITIIDCSKGELKFCFMSLHGLECMDDNMPRPSRLTPIDVRTYISLHYPDWDRPEKDGALSKEQLDSLKKDYKGKELQDTLDRIRKENTEFRTQMRKDVEYLSKFKTLTLEECVELFPEMYKGKEQKLVKTTVTKKGKKKVTAVKDTNPLLLEPVTENSEPENPVVTKTVIKDEEHSCWTVLFQE